MRYLKSFYLKSWECKTHFGKHYSYIKKKKKAGSLLKLMLHYVFLLHPAVTHRQITALVGGRL